jgi:hypothetical protein
MASRLSSSTLAAAFFSSVVLPVVVVVAAQSPLPSPSNRTIVRGCVELTEQSPVGTSGTVGSIGDADLDTTFILTGASVVSPIGAPVPVGLRAPDRSTYRLGMDEGKLWAHVGHRVEISGTIASETVSAIFPMLRVETVKLIASTCASPA